MTFEEKYQEQLKLNKLRINLKKLVDDLDECNLDYAKLKLKEALNEL